MKSLKNLKKTSLIIFFFMIVPYGKLVIINGFIMITDFGLAFMKNGLYPQGYFFLPCCLIGLYLIYFKNRYYPILGFILTYLWLYYLIDYKDLVNNLTVSVSVLVYVLMSIYTIFKLIITIKNGKTNLIP